MDQMLTEESGDAYAHTEVALLTLLNVSVTALDSDMKDSISSSILHFHFGAVGGDVRASAALGYRHLFGCDCFCV